MMAAEKRHAWRPDKGDGQMIEKVGMVVYEGEVAHDIRPRSLRTVCDHEKCLARG
jgi:hypothetical protein